MKKSTNILLGLVILTAAAACVRQQSQTPMIAKIISKNCTAKGLFSLRTDQGVFQNTPEFIYGKTQADAEQFCYEVQEGQTYVFNIAPKIHHQRSLFPNIVTEPQ